MTTNDSMPVPSWVGEARGQMFEGHQDLSRDKQIDARDLPVVDSFSNLFAEYEVRGHDLLVHVFARGGEKDRYWPSELKEDGTRVEGRLELTGPDAPDFPNDIVNRIKAAVDKVWQGDVAIDKATMLKFEDEEAVVESVTMDRPPVEEDMKAYAVQFQGAANTVNTVGVSKFVDQFCEALDSELE